MNVIFSCAVFTNKSQKYHSIHRKGVTQKDLDELASNQYVQ